MPVWGFFFFLGRGLKDVERDPSDWCFEGDGTNRVSGFAVSKCDGSLAGG